MSIFLLLLVRRLIAVLALPGSCIAIGAISLGLSSSTSGLRVLCLLSLALVLTVLPLALRLLFGDKLLLASLIRYMDKFKG